MAAKILNWIKRKLQHWLEVDRALFNANSAHARIDTLHSEFNAQMSMAGIDVSMRGEQTQIIFISRLGREGTGTVQIKHAYFRDVYELVDFIKFVDRSFGRDRVAIDVPYGMGPMIQQERKRHR